MPLGKYYCDYCEKEFQDTPIARKRHLQSSSHLRAKSLWYSTNTNTNISFRASSDAGFPKGVCNRFAKTGFCPFGDSCKYLHTSPTPQASSFVENQPSPILSTYQLVGRSAMQGDVLRDSMGMSWGNLPPSLRPPPECGYLPLPFVDWG
ncbi:hypothetical protein K2173_027019 [Erythroxylum novogranatense]|uniref:C3H1-type domain-containing protein n=1 Tax=Erythroxylum novogranatense TaxID=1862640 RepID=A0AAV8TY36_9ROSI|nr:hypothetical protein K2173_027019 [Erythroxylum novogranatense]